MSKITASDVNNLRKSTGAGMMDCKKALVEAEGNFDKAVEILRKKGQKISAKRADRAASEGAVIAKTSADSTCGVIIELNCETDFVAKNDGFVQLAHKIAEVALDKLPENLENLKSMEIEGLTLDKRLLDEMGKIGEKIEVSKYYKVNGKSMVPYIHAGNKLGVLVEMNNSVSEKNLEAGRDVAMQIAALNPVSVDENSVSEEVKEQELRIGREIALKEGKPEQIVDKIAQGKLQRFYKDNTLLSQPFVKDSSLNVGKYLNSVEDNLTVLSFLRIQLG